MVMNLIFNASILLLCVFVYYLAVLRTAHRPSGPHRLHRLITGLVFGLAGVFLILRAVRIEDNVRIDFRGIAILFSTMLGGLPSGLITTALVGTARFLQGGIYYASLIGVGSSFVIAAGCAWIRKKVSGRGRAYAAAFGFMYAVTSVVYVMVIRDAETLRNMILFYGVTALPTVWLIFQLNAVLDRMHKLYEQLHNNEETYRQLFHGALDIVYLTEIGPDGGPVRFLDVNETACQVLGYEREQLLQMKPEELYDRTQLHRLKEIRETFARTGKHTFEWTLMTRQGAYLQVEISGRVFHLHGKLVCLSMVRDISLRKEAERKLLEANRVLEKLSLSDGLTGIANRRGFDAFYLVSWEQTAAHSEPLALLMLDIDCFKAYNDTYGHAMGDLCLKKAGNVLDHWASQAGGLAARYGGEEFVVVLPGAGLEEAEAQAERIRGAVEELAVPHTASAAGEYVTVSVGAAACYPGNGVVTREALLQTADRALYDAKHTGRNRVKARGAESFSRGQS